MPQYVRPGEALAAVLQDVIEILIPQPQAVVDQVLVVATSGGVTGLTALAYNHRQLVASDTWTITHSLGFYPNVTVVDSANSLVEGEIAYTNRNSLIATFSASFSGNAYLS